MRTTSTLTNNTNEKGGVTSPERKAFYFLEKKKKDNIRFELKCVAYPHSKCCNFEKTLNGKHAGEANVHVAQCYLEHVRLIVNLCDVTSAISW